RDRITRDDEPRLERRDVGCPALQVARNRRKRIPVIVAKADEQQVIALPDGLVVGHPRGARVGHVEVGHPAASLQPRRHRLYSRLLGHGDLLRPQRGGRQRRPYVQLATSSMMATTTMLAGID